MEQAIDFLFQDMDTNEDGKISKKEWLAAHERQMNKLDRDGDGLITKDEIRTDMRARMAEAEQSRPRRSGPQ
jgi:Ca2+-binding EF-hand superfamily protein